METPETPVFLYKSYGSVLLFWRVRTQIFLRVNGLLNSKKINLFKNENKGEDMIDF